MKSLHLCFLVLIFMQPTHTQEASTLSYYNVSQLEESCALNTPSNGFEGFTGSLNGLILANDFFVDAGYQFEVNRLKVHIVSHYYSNPNYISGAPIFYEDNINNEGPGNFLGLATSITSSYSFLGNYDESGNYKVYEFIFDFDPIMFEGGVTGNKFWLGFTVGNGTWELAEYWETTSIMNSDNGIYIDNGNIFEFESFISNLENVFELSGVCNTLNVPEVDGSEISIFPNPVKDVLNLSYPESASLTAVLSNISGQKMIKTNDRKIDMSQYATGLYFLQLTDPVTGTSQIQKIIKN